MQPDCALCRHDHVSGSGPGLAVRWAARQRQTEERKAAELARREAAAAAAREQRLDELAADPERAWQRWRS